MFTHPLLLWSWGMHKGYYDRKRIASGHYAKYASGLEKYSLGIVCNSSKWFNRHPALDDNIFSFFVISMFNEVSTPIDKYDIL